MEVPPEATRARDALAALLPRVELPELLMEVDRWTDFTRTLTHLTGRREPTAEHLAAIRPALFAVLVAEATNLGFATMARAAGLPEAQLARVYDWYFREETLRQAIVALITHHRTLPLTARFGAGTTSSSDGVRFGVAASTLNARHHPRYFGMRRGVTVYSHVSDQGTQFWIDVVNCQLREATYVLDGLLYQETLPIHEHYTDTHGYTDILFGLFEVLGYHFAPRLRDLPDQVLARAHADADYGALDAVLRQPIRGDLIARHWDELHRLGASLKDGLAVPSLVVAKLQALQRQNPLQQALQELGRLAKNPAHPAVRRRPGAQAAGAGWPEQAGAAARPGPDDLLRAAGALRRPGLRGPAQPRLGAQPGHQCADCLGHDLSRRRRGRPRAARAARLRRGVGAPDAAAVGAHPPGRAVPLRGAGAPRQVASVTGERGRGGSRD